MAAATASAPPLPKVAIPGQRLGPAAAYAPGPGTHVHDAFVCASIAGPVMLDAATSTGGNAGAGVGAKRTAVGGYGQQPRSRPMLAVSRGTPLPSSSSSLSSSSLTPATATATASPLPTVDSVVLGRVTRVQRRQATLSILVVLPPGSGPGSGSLAAGGRGEGGGGSASGSGGSGSGGDGSGGTASSAAAAAAADAAVTAAATAEPDAAVAAVLARMPSTVNFDNNNADELRFQALIRREDVRAVEKDKVVMDDMFRVGDVVRAVILSVGDQSFYYAGTARNELGVVLARSADGNMMFPVSWREMRDPVTGRSELRNVAKPY